MLKVGKQNLMKLLNMKAPGAIKEMKLLEFKNRTIVFDASNVFNLY